MPKATNVVVVDNIIVVVVALFFCCWSINANPRLLKASVEFVNSKERLTRNVKPRFLAGVGGEVVLVAQPVIGLVFRSNSSSITHATD